MVNITSIYVKNEISLLSEKLQNEWKDICRYYSTKSDEQIFQDFKKRWENFQGSTIKEFTNMSNSVYIEWKYWKCINGYLTEFGDKSLTNVWNEFKTDYGLYTLESNEMFQEMDQIKMSNRMYNEWHMKSNFDFPHIYEEEEQETDYYLKSKAQLWEEFKKVWEIDIENYNEDKYKEMIDFINEIKSNDLHDQQFYKYRENANYHSFDSYSIFEQFDICQYYYSRS